MRVIGLNILKIKKAIQIFHLAFVFFPQRHLTEKQIFTFLIFFSSFL